MTKKFLIIGLLLLALLFTFAGASRVQANEIWQAIYWNNKNFSGDPVLVRQELELNHEWHNSAPPGVIGDQFSARWTKTMNVSPGTYRFTATMDDGMRVAAVPRSGMSSVQTISPCAGRARLIWSRDAMAGQPRPMMGCGYGPTAVSRPYRQRRGASLESNTRLRQRLC